MKVIYINEFHLWNISTGGRAGRSGASQVPSYSRLSSSNFLCSARGGSTKKGGGKGHTDSSSDTYRRRSMGVIEENKKKESLDYA